MTFFLLVCLLTNCLCIYSYLSKGSSRTISRELIRNNWGIRLAVSAGSTEKATITTPLTKDIFDSINQREQQAGGAGASTSYQGLLNLDKVWKDLKAGSWQSPAKEVVEDKQGYVLGSVPQYDVVVSGGTLGIFYAAALQKKGLRVAVIERSKVAGREQEWNISKKELNALIKLGILKESQFQEIIGIEFNPVRIGFNSDTSKSSKDPGFEVYVKDILNLGVKPDRLISLVKDSFVQDGGVVIEDVTLQKVSVYQDAAEITYAQSSNSSSGKVSIVSKMIIDAMGGSSPIMRQLRGPVAPDGVCVVVGSCARGFPAANNTYSDLIYTDTPIIQTKTTSVPVQYFWEAFPAGSSPIDRTSYMFTYMDAQPGRPSVLDIMEDYWELMPRYQGVALQDLTFLRILYGMFPVYRKSPLQTDIARILPVGDASGVQSPLSFGGFGSLTRHIERIVNAVTEAVEHDLLTANDLRRINFYMPNLSSYWMFQRAMSVPLQKSLSSPTAILQTLRNSFSAMDKLGEDVMRPFLQDVLQFVPLFRTLLLAAKQDPFTPFKIVPHVGIRELLTFLYHFMWVGIYTLCSLYASSMMLWLADKPFVSARIRFQLHRLVEAWKFGSGLDFNDHQNIVL